MLLEEGMATHSGILAWRIPWTEEHGGLQSIGSQRVIRNWGDLVCTHKQAAVDHRKDSQIILVDCVTYFRKWGKTHPQNKGTHGPWRRAATVGLWGCEVRLKEVGRMSVRKWILCVLTVHSESLPVKEESCSKMSVSRTSDFEMTTGFAWKSFHKQNARAASVYKKGGRLFNYGTLPTTSRLWVGYFDVIVLVFLLSHSSLSSEIFATTYP